MFLCSVFGTRASGQLREESKRLTSGTSYGRFRHYLTKAGLPPAGLHLLRHTAAKLRRDAGESVEEAARFLDHSSLVMATTYLRQPEGQEARGLGTGG